MKQLLFILLLTLTTLFAQDARLDNYPQALQWEKNANVNADSAYNLGYIYQTKIKDYDKAIELYNLSYSLKESGDTANNLGTIYEHIKNYKEAIKWYEISSNYGKTEPLYNIALLYTKKLKEHKKAIPYYKKAIERGDKDAPVSLALLYKKLHQYDDAIFYYKKAYDMGNIGGANGLGYLYETSLKDSRNAKVWYKKAAKRGYYKSYKNLALCNRDNGKKIIGAAWYIALIDIKYSKNKVLTYLKTKWNLTDKELKKAYRLQQTLDIPKHYTGGID